MQRIGFRSLPFAATLFVGLTFCAAQIGCSQSTRSMHSSTAVPASDGTVRALEGADGNTDVVILVTHLAVPAKVQSDATVYVVWFQPPDGASQNMGAMEVDDDLEGRFDGSTPHRRFRVSVTPEPHRAVAHPSHPAVFTAEVDRTK